MHVLLIEDDNYKAQCIINDLSKLHITDVDLEQSRNDGIQTFIEHINDNPYDFVITDNCLPTCVGDYGIHAYAKNITRTIRKYDSDVKIYICSSAEVDTSDIDADGMIVYEFGYDMLDIWRDTLKI